MSTMKDVAKLAQVSVMTVSRVINNESNVKPETRDKVMSAIRELHYQPNNAARMMRGVQSNTIALITDEVITTPYSVNIISGAQAAARSLGKLLLVASTEKNRIFEEKTVNEFVERRVEGFVYATMYHQAVTLTEVLENQPVILVNCVSAGSPLPSIVPNEYLLGIQAAEYCVKQGHKRIALLGLLPHNIATKQRLAGSLATLKRYGLTPPAHWQRHAHQVVNGQETNCLEAELKALVESDPRPSVILCGNDDVAMQCYFEFHRYGLRIPEDISLIGVDNSIMISPRLVPGLTTFEIPYFEMGFRAVKYLVDQRFSLEQEKVSYPLVERDSVATIL